MRRFTNRETRAYHRKKREAQQRTATRIHDTQQRQNDAVAEAIERLRDVSGAAGVELRASLARGEGGRDPGWHVRFHVGRWQVASWWSNTGTLTIGPQRLTAETIGDALTKVMERL